MKMPNPKSFEDIDGDIDWYEFWQYVCKNICDKNKTNCGECKKNTEDNYYK